MKTENIEGSVQVSEEAAKMDVSEDVLQEMERMQKECHKMVEQTLAKTSPDVSYQDATNLYFFLKLAELSQAIRKL